jgi:pseudouridine-5'-phosphate glycosidase/pseudouridine kinase
MVPLFFFSHFTYPNESKGMPYPTNLTTALSLESHLRTQKVTPATIAILDSKVHIGLTQPQLERLADPGLSNAVKVSRRDIGACLSLGLIGGTTVAGTMVLARSVGIQCFVTGGIGGVHRGAENSGSMVRDWKKNR